MTQEPRSHGRDAGPSTAPGNGSAQPRDAYAREAVERFLT